MSSFTEQFSTPEGTDFAIIAPADEEWSICSESSHSDAEEMEHVEVDASRESGSKHDSVDIGTRRVATGIAIHEEDPTGRDKEFFPPPLDTCCLQAGTPEFSLNPTSGAD